MGLALFPNGNRSVSIWEQICVHLGLQGLVFFLCLFLLISSRAYMPV
jgi:hypothetical protein